MSAPVARHRLRRAAPSMDQRGETSTQIAVMIPILMLLVLLGVQAALWFHAANVAQVAASRGAGAGSVRGAGDSAAAAEAVEVAVENGAAVRSTMADVSGDFVVVTVTLDVAHLVPFFPDTVTRVQREPIERFIVESDR